jgi:hypothetical protein
MSTQVRQSRSISRGIDYLGDLGAKLRDLQGFATLAHELIQNADDADGAGHMAFDVTEEALVVDNDGTFTDCGHAEELECPWKDDPSRRYLCDFHGLRYVASGHKRERRGTTGAFGIGFISVYQATDRPELISAGRHWVLHEDKPESERIEVCEGCEFCQDAALPNTRFILPWVHDPDSPLRKALRAPALPAEAPTQLLEELKRSLPTAILFLKNLGTLEVLHEGKPVLRLQRLAEQDSLIVSDGGRDRIWHLLRGNFDQVAAELRQRHANRIEPKRTANVTLAIPEEPLENGLFCACLPTQQGTGLPFHLNADLFTTNDRKRIILESDYQSEWNRAAVRAAAEVLRGNLGRLPELLRHKHLWHVFKSTHRVSEEAKAGHREKSLETFWNRLQPELRQAPVFYTTRGEWKSATEVLFLSEEEADATPVLEGLGLSLLHPDLRPFYNLYRSQEVGVQPVDVDDVVQAMQQAGLVTRVKLSAVPSYLRTEKARRQLRRELAVLLGRRRKIEDQRVAERQLKRCAVAPGKDKFLWPLGEVYRTDEETAALFASIDPTIPFLADLEEESEPLRSLCPEFSPVVAVERLRRILETAANDSQERTLDPLPLLRWFESRRSAVLATTQVKCALASLAIFPTSEGLRPLTELSLPGDFTDQIGLAGVVDLHRLGGRREFLRDLGAREMTFARYAAGHVPAAFRSPDVTAEQKRKAILLLAERLGEIFEDNEVRDALAAAPLVECEDGLFRRPGEVYFATEAVRVFLGGEVHLAALPEGHEGIVGELYRWLGVTEHPRYEAITKRVKALTASPPDEQLVEAVGTIFRHLGGRVREGDKNTDPLMVLRALPWLPARGDRARWHRPGDLFAVFQDYLFETQARFLDLPREVQSSSGDLLDFLLVKIKPTPHQVVAHLLMCAETGTPVNKEVYRYLNDNAQDPSLNQLRDKPCLLLPDDTYVKASQVFWGEHPFGRFRHRLGPDLRRYEELFAQLGVRETCDHRDALLVLQEVSAQYGAGNRILDEGAHTVLMACWQRLERALGDGLITDQDLGRFASTKVIPDTRCVLNPPEWMFFEDRAGLSAKFRGFLQNNVITRPQGAWRAMGEAGVRFLGNAVRSHLVECNNPVDDDLVVGLLFERQQQLARVLEPHDTDVGHADLSLLTQMRCQSVTELKIQYSLKAFNCVVTSDPESVPAHYQPEEKLLYYVPRAGQVPWPSLARELALALYPDADPGRLASGLKEVLSAQTEESAQAILDELGFAPLEAAAEETATHSTMVTDLGGQDSVPDSSWPAPATPTEAGPSAAGEEELSPEDAIKQILGTGTPGPTPLPGELQNLLRPHPPTLGERRSGAQKSTGAGRSGSTRRSEGENRSRTHARVQVKLRTYVSSDSGEREEREHSAQRDAVDRAGMDRVLDYEKRQGRHPNEMPPKHPGYDIESENDANDVVRYIEVKSLSGDWEYSNAGLSDVQFKKATELGDRYWLYVVERADQPTYRIHRIQNPAARADQFLFDDGWQALAEVDADHADETVDELEGMDKRTTEATG